MDTKTLECKVQRDLEQIHEEVLGRTRNAPEAEVERVVRDFEHASLMAFQKRLIQTCRSATRREIADVTGDPEAGARVSKEIMDEVSSVDIPPIDETLMRRMIKGVISERRATSVSTGSDGMPVEALGNTIMAAGIALTLCGLIKEWYALSLAGMVVTGAGVVVRTASSVHVSKRQVEKAIETQDVDIRKALEKLLEKRRSELLPLFATMMHQVECRLESAIGSLSQR